MGIYLFFVFFFVIDENRSVEITCYGFTGLTGPEKLHRVIFTFLSVYTFVVYCEQWALLTQKVQAS